MTGNQLYWVDRDKNNKIVPRYKTDDVTLTTNSREVVGNRIPDLYGSLTNDFRYKGFDLSILTTYSIGGEMLDGVYGSMMNVGYKGYVWHKNALRRWQKPGDITDVPKIMWDQQIRVTDQDLINASYFAIKNITLGYTLPKTLTRKLTIERLRVYVQAENLVTWTKYWGFDPEISSGATSLGVDRGIYPQARTYTVGVNVSF